MLYERGTNDAAGRAFEPRILTDSISMTEILRDWPFVQISELDASISADYFMFARHICDNNMDLCSMIGEGNYMSSRVSMP